MVADELQTTSCSYFSSQASTSKVWRTCPSPISQLCSIPLPSFVPVRFYPSLNQLPILYFPVLSHSSILSMMSRVGFVKACPNNYDTVASCKKTQCDGSSLHFVHDCVLEYTTHIAAAMGRNRAKMEKTSPEMTSPSCEPRQHTSHLPENEIRVVTINLAVPYYILHCIYATLMQVHVLSAEYSS